MSNGRNQRHLYRSRPKESVYLRYTDSVTGQKIEKSARTPKKREAVKRAGEWLAEFQNGLGTKNPKLKWGVFRESYECMLRRHCLKAPL